MKTGCQGRFAALLAVLGVLLLLSVVVGPAGLPLSPADALRAIFRMGSPSDLAVELVWQVRIPRALLAVGVGGLLSMSGAALQGMLINPLADPYICGTAGGAAFGAALVEIIGPAAGISLALMEPTMVCAAFTGAVAATTLVYTLSRKQGRLNVTAFLLAGTAVGTLLWALIPLAMAVANRLHEMPRILHYLLGSLQGASWETSLAAVAAAGACAAILLASSRELDILTFGEESAHSLGVPVESVKRRALLLSAFSTALAVSAAGVVGFVGLTAPHMARRLVGTGHRRLLPAAAVCGACITLASDTLVRTLLNDAPLGTVTAVLGAPLFIYLVTRSLPASAGGVSRRR